MLSPNLIFPFKKPSQDDIHQEAIKWSIGDSGYEIYITILDDFGLEQLLPHCLSIINKINAIVGTEVDKAPSMY